MNLTHAILLWEMDNMKNQEDHKNVRCIKENL